MEEIDLRKLEKMMDDYFDNLTEEQFMADMKKKGINVIEEMEENALLEGLENGNNIVIPIRKKKKKKPANKGYNNQSLRRRH